MEQLIILGTGNANAIHCYNTCSAICPDTTLPAEDREYFLIDAGGGNGILGQLEKAEIPVRNIHHIFLTHEHTDHILGMVWMIRIIAAEMKKGKYDGDLQIYTHADLVEPLLTIVRLTVQGKFVKLIGERIFIHPLEDGDTKHILDYDVTFFDIHSTKAKQYGCYMTLKNGKKIVFTGDEPYQEHERSYVENADYLLHEAFCLYTERDKFKPYEKHHTTALEASQMAEDLGIKTLWLYHTEDTDLAHRREKYSKEAREAFSGTLYIPDDLERYEL